MSMEENGVDGNSILEETVMVVTRVDPGSHCLCVSFVRWEWEKEKKISEDDFWREEDG